MPTHIATPNCLSQEVTVNLLKVIYIYIYTSSSLTLITCYWLLDHTHFSCCSPITPAFSVGHFVSVKLYWVIINQDCTLVYALMEVLFYL